MNTIEPNGQSLGMNKREVWTKPYKGLFLEISRHGLERLHNFEPLNNGHGCWCAYIYIYERKTKKFNECWLENKIEKWFETSPSHITNDYMNGLLADFDWHGGITYYQNLCETLGHRIIKAGCDYSHYSDQERDYNFSLEEILNETKHVADQIIERLEVKE